MNCETCQIKFTPRTVAGRPQRYCSSTCRRKAQNERARSPVAGVSTFSLTSGASNVLTPTVAAWNSPAAPEIDVEWLDVFSDLHRCVAGRLNKTRTTFRERAVGMDRTPLAHAVRTEAGWIGKVRAKGAVIWASEPRALDDAKFAVELQLAARPELLAEQLALAA